jgi:hypothetical protein
MIVALRYLLTVLAASLGFGILAAPALAMSFSLSPMADPDCGSNCPLVIVASGEIELDSNERFFAFVTSEVVGQKVTSVVLMSSPGGNLVGSLRLGILMRQLGFSIMVGQVRNGRFITANCFSACAYTLAGGKRRFVPEGSKVGVHKAWTKAPGASDEAGIDGLTSGRIPTSGYQPVLETYLRRMGVSGQLVTLANATSADDIRVLSRSELARLRVVTANGRNGRRRG